MEKIKFFGAYDMGKYCSSGKSHLTINKKYYNLAYNALDFVDDDDKSDEENLIDCLLDFYISCTQRDADSLTFIVSDGNSDVDFDWQMMLDLTPYLDEGSYYEQLLNDQDRILIGTVKQDKKEKQLVRDFYQLLTNDKNQFIRGEFIENFDVDLALD